MYENQRSGLGAGRLIIALIIAGVSLFAYCGRVEKNPVTGESQHIDMSVDQEIALGVQAAPEMAAQYGGLDPDPRARALVEEVGQEIVSKSRAAGSPYRFQFHALANDQTVNAFALPGGQIFITRALLTKLRTRGQLAGVLGHEVGHVIARHSAEHLAKAKLTQGLTGAAAVASYDPYNRSSRVAGAVALMVGQLINLNFSRSDEIEADKWGVILMTEAGYDPHSMIEVMEVLKQASGPNRQPEFFATHPNPENREERIKQVIAEQYPNGLPPSLKP